VTRSAALRVTSRNARFQEWQALLANRTKRQRSGTFLVQGVRPITQAVRHGWEIRELLYDAESAPSGWATGVLDTVAAPRFAVSTELIRELSGKTDAPAELLAIVGMPPDDLGRIPVEPALLVLVFDRPTSPGNIGTLVRSADAFGASGVVVVGHAADVYDPKSVRASTGSLFCIPVVRIPSARQVLAWLDAARTTGLAIQLIGTDETGAIDIAEVDLAPPSALLIGNEKAGLSAAWRDACDCLARIPIAGSASSLNAATAASIALYEATRQRARASR
jgi:TrmH family RNA methyltransferase